MLRRLLLLRVVASVLPLAVIVGVESRVVSHLLHIAIGLFAAGTQ